MGRPKSWRKTVVVGAGPVGSLAALYAANRGDQVEVYDLRTDLRKSTASTSTNESKSINLALSERGINAIRNTGYDDFLEDVFDIAIPMHGRMIHTRSRDGTFKEESQAYDVHGRFQRSIDRNDLNALLLDKLSTLPNVTLYFQQKLTGADFVNKKAWFEDLSAKSAAFSPDNPSRRAPEHEVTFDLMIGADGAHSAVRYHLMKFARVDYTQTYIDCLWCEFSMDALPSPDSQTNPLGYRISPSHLHIWPGRTSMFIALPTPSGSFVCTLFGTVSLFNLLQSQASTPALFTSTFNTLFPGVTQHIPPHTLLAQFSDNPHLPLITVKATPHHFASSVVILGDAANAMVPFYGQGMNAGLESVETLFRIIDASKTAQSRHDAGFDSTASDREQDALAGPDAYLAAALAEYSATRVPDAHAITELALGNYREMAAGVVSRRYKVRKWVEETLDKWAPWLGWKTQYARVSFGRERYSSVIERGRWQGKVVERVENVVGVGVMGAVAWGVARWWGTRQARR